MNFCPRATTKPYQITHRKKNTATHLLATKTTPTTFHKYACFSSLRAIDSRYILVTAEGMAMLRPPPLLYRPRLLSLPPIPPPPYAIRIFRRLEPDYLPDFARGPSPVPGAELTRFAPWNPASPLVLRQQRRRIGLAPACYP